MRRFIAGLLTLFVLGSASIIAGSVYFVIQSLAPDRGDYVVPGLQATTEVYRDRLGIPHVFAETSEDAAYALGFLHASDRLWQMEGMRRLGHGRLAEVIGESGLPSDRLVRTLGIPGLAEAQFENLTPETQRLLEAYAAGVNAWIERHRGGLPIEFVVLGYQPAPWRPADSLVWAKIMAMRLSGNWRDELLRARMATRLTDQQLLAFWYPDGDASVEAPSAFSDMSADQLRTVLAALPVAAIADASPVTADQPQGASNAWVVRKSRSDTGSPIVANDPHLGYSLPGLWYLVRIDTPNGVLAGASVPGVPFVILGRNSDIAWGMTTTQSDQQDVFIERLSGDGRFYEDVNGNWLPVESRKELIAVAGANDVELSIRRTRHGPIISDLVDPMPGVTGPGYALSLSAAYLAPDDRTPDAMQLLNRAGDWDSFLAALASFHTPQQNFVYADRAGNIGFFAPGRVPMRRSGRGRMPVPGWTGAGDWQDWVPYDELPIAFNPAADRIVSANNRIVSTDYPHFITDDWAPPYRAGRIFELLDATPRHTRETFRVMQSDLVSPMARDLIDRMTAISPSDPRAAEATELLSRWDGVMSPDAREPLLFVAWLRQLQRVVSEDELGDLADEASRIRPRFLDRVLFRDSAWCDDIRTPLEETCDEVLEIALAESLRDVQQMAQHRRIPETWGAFHAARFVNPVTSALPGIGHSLGILEVPIGGGNDTLNRAGMRTSDPAFPFATIHGPGYRAVYDLHDLDRSRFVIATGQSGNPFSMHHADFVELWRDGKSIELVGKREAFVSAGVLPIRLLPETAADPAPPKSTGWFDSAAIGIGSAVRGLMSP
ncbi:MAG: penicillin acylase family protein [Rhodospirillales bacterium]